MPCFIEGTPVEAEILFCARYIKKIENEIKWDLDFWWKSLRDYFCIVDASSLDIFWNWVKHDYQLNIFEYKYCKNYANKISRGIEFSDWLTLYNKKDINWDKYLNEHERYDENHFIKNYKF